MLTQNEITSLPWVNVIISDSKIIANYQVVEINGNFYTVHGNITFPNSCNLQIRCYNKNGQIILFDSQNRTLARLQSADVIKSKVDDFNGFAYGKTFELRNGQVWQQSDSLDSPCQPGGDVWILNHNIMRVANWNFDIVVTQIKE